MGQVLSSILRLLCCNWKPDRSKGLRDHLIGKDVDDDQTQNQNQSQNQLILPVQLQQPQPPADQSCCVDIIIDYTPPPPTVDGGHQQPLPGLLSVASSDHHIHNQITTAHPAIPFNKITKTRRAIGIGDVTPAHLDPVTPNNKITKTQRAISNSDVTPAYLDPVIPNNKITKTQSISDFTPAYLDPVTPNNRITKTQRISDVTPAHLDPVIPCNKITKTQRAISISDVTTSERVAGTKRIGPYTSSQEILLVGEGDFSFSACLAVAFGSATNMIATSLNTREYLLTNYAYFSSNKKKLVIRGCTVLHGIDATQMATHPQLSRLKFDCIVFNFPHSGFGSEDESISTETRRHQKLVSGFLRNAKKMIKKNGQIHIRHKCNDFFLKWNIPKLGSDQGLFLMQEANFKRSMFPGYHTKYGFGGDKDFNCHPSKTYLFGLSA